MTAIPHTTPPTIAPIFGVEAVVFLLGASMEPGLESVKWSVDVVLN
jgi:hypothetical protein